MHSASADIEAWAVAARLLIESAYLLSRGMEPGENILFSLVIESAAVSLSEAAEAI